MPAYLCVDLLWVAHSRIYKPRTLRRQSQTVEINIRRSMVWICLFGRAIFIGMSWHCLVMKVVV